MRKYEHVFESRGRCQRGDGDEDAPRRVLAAGVDTPLCCHSRRATGVTNYLSNGGTLEKTTKLYDRREDELTLDEVEQIAI